MSSAPHILILAAGQGKRMLSQLPKVLHPVLFRPMLHHVLDLAHSIPHASLSVIVGHGEQTVRAGCQEYEGLQFFRQDAQRGTAHAVRTAETFLAQARGDVLILSGDVPLLQTSTIESLLRTHRESAAALTFLTAILDNPRGYGRVLRDAKQRVTGIREQVDCSDQELAVTEVNAGVYCFRNRDLLGALARIGDRNRQGEFYLTDSISLLSGDGARVEGLALEDPREMLGINDRVGLAQVEGILQERVNRRWMLAGVTLQNPSTVFIDVRSQIGPDSRVEAGCQVIGSRIGAGSVVEANSRIVHSTVGEGALIRQGSYLESSQVGEGCAVGPYAHLRPGSALGRDVKIGNFVEVKKSTLADGAKASHLSYIGDAEIGKNVNLGCGFVTCNYDGVAKHKTIIEDDVFVGSDSQTVAPVRIGRGTYVASGSTVTDDVPPDSLVLSRGRQITKAGYAAKYRRKKP